MYGVGNTADIGLRIYGKDLKELFTNAAEGLFDIIVERDKIKFTGTRPIRIKLESSNLEELLVSWLSELLFLFSVDSYFFERYQIEEINKASINALAFGQKLKISPEFFKVEVKAVTFHNLSVKKTGSNWQAEVIFDV